MLVLDRMGCSTSAWGTAEEEGITVMRANTLLGSILRLMSRGTKGYEVPLTIHGPAVTMYAQKYGRWGFNPWRFIFHPQTRDLYIGDIGESNVEEVNIVDGMPRGSTGAHHGRQSMLS